MRAVAVVNGNARRVRGEVCARLERALPGRVRLTASLAHARAVIRDEVRRGLDLIVLAGGDGTFVMGAALIAEACRGAGRPEPAIGVLRLGTGNAIADAAGASDDAPGDLARLARGDGAWRTLPLIDVLGLRAPFAGLGVDAQLLEDQRAVGHAIDRVPGGRRLVGGAARYALSVALRSVPRFALARRPTAVVTNTGAPAIEMARNGPTGRVLATGSVLWRGACTLIAGATIPCFGFGIRMFAFGDARPDRFHLRCGDPGLLEILRSTPAAFRGEYFSDHVRDFLCERVAIELDDDAPVEAGGELIASCRRVELGLGAPVTLVALDRAPP
ncbi:MAG TPA: diacylglycerol kinase family protein [Kofleriaceae bacterium]|nr:diacylglycerol kinase family protein [Kofleriaceae bacterium]